MKRTNDLLSKQTLLTLLIASFITCQCFGSTYTAVASGNWSSNATWGLSAPSFNLTSDQVVIPVGITVTLDNSLTINGVTASVSVLGALNSMNNDSITLNYGSITGTGTLTLGGLVLDTSALLAFTGSITTGVLTTSAATLTLAANVTSTQDITIDAGVLGIGNSGTLMLDSGATLKLAGGTLSVSGGGALTLTSNYNVIYSGASVTGGVELGGSGLQNVTVNIPDSGTLSLSQDLTVKGMLTLTSGILVLNSYNLSIRGNLVEGSGAINATASSNITVNTASSPSGALTLMAGANTVNNLNINITGYNGALMLGSDINVNNSLNFTSGSLSAGTHGVIMGAGATITGAGNSSYIITGDSGYLSMPLTAGNGSSKFEIGTGSYYAPATVSLASGSASGNVRLSVAHGVDAQGTTGTDLSATEPVVAATWFVASDISTNLNLTLGVSWSAAMEANGFNTDSAYISHYTGGRWDTSTAMAATHTGAMFSLQRSGITSLSPFAVFGYNATTTAINAAGAETSGFLVFPNPVSQNLTITNPENLKDVKLQIIDLTGQVVRNYVLTEHTNMIPVGDLTAGTYQVRLFNENINQVTRIIKM